MAHKIVFQPMGISTEAEKGENLLRVAQIANVGITAYCGSKKTCGKCKVKIVEGDFKKHGINSSLDNASKMGEVEKKFLVADEIQNNYRLACNVSVEGNLVIEVPKESKINDEIILHDAKDMNVYLNPAVKIYTLELEKATLEDYVDDITRIVNALKEKYTEVTGDIDIDFIVIKQLSEIVRKSKWKINVVLLNNNKIIRVTSADYNDLYGFAIDVGTTTLAVYLCDLVKGEVVQTGSMMNPQISYGDDVLSRISHCQENAGGVEQLRELLLDGLNDLTRDLMDKENIEKEAVVDTVIVFNTVMQHIALGISPKYIGVSPFVSTISKSMDIKARDFGLNFLESGNVHCLPAEAGFIGSDNVAVLIGEEPYLHEEMKLIIDIGTNSEICLGNKEQLYVTSCATGPALEGAQISCGMRAAKGAIEKVKINPITLDPVILTIGGKDISPIGICGSGIIDVVSEMASVGIIEPNGKFSSQLANPRIRKNSKGKFEYVLYFKNTEFEKDIVITQNDVRAVQLAKAALYAGAKMLMKHCKVEKIDEIILAGAFGSYIDREKALKLGLYPDCLLENVRSVGNGAGLGARLALLNKDKRTEADEVAENVEFLEIATNMDYQKYFAQAMGIPHEKDVFSINHPCIWPCGGNDSEDIGEEIINMGNSIFENEELLEKALLMKKDEEKTSYLTLPLFQGMEAMAYGGTPSIVGENYVFSEYKYNDLKDLDLNKSILSENIAKYTVNIIDKNKEGKIIMNISGPFSLLSSLIDPTKLYKYRRTNKQLLLDTLNYIADTLGEYTLECIEKGVDLISFADTEGVMEIVGNKFYEEISGVATFNYLKKIEPGLKNAVVHICGKTSYSLHKAGFMLAKNYRVESDKEYSEILFDYAKDKKFTFIGHNCIQMYKLGIPIIYKLELIE